MVDKFINDNNLVYYYSRYTSFIFPSIFIIIIFFIYFNHQLIQLVILQ